MTDKRDVYLHKIEVSFYSTDSESTHCDATIAKALERRDEVDASSIEIEAHLVDRVGPLED